MKQKKYFKFMKKLEEYSKCVGMEEQKLRWTKEEGIKEEVKKWDREEWKKGLQQKNSVRLYYENKEEIAEEKIYDNT